MISRRGFILGTVGVGTAVVAGGGLLKAAENGVFSAGDGDAFSAWDAPLEGMQGIAAAGVLAANSHNTQPWKLRVGDGTIDVLGDNERLMGAADPRLRELHLSLGCVIENMAVAAAAQGRTTGVEFVRGGDHFARLTFAHGETDASYAALAEQIPLRRTNRGAYDVKRAPKPATLETLAACAGDGVGVRWLSSAGERDEFSALTVKATEVHVNDAAMQRDSHAWYRMKWSEVEQHKDGITIDGAAVGLIGTTMLKMFPPTSDAFDEGWTKVTRETHCATAPLFGLLVAGAADDRSAWVTAGRVYQRMQLEATRLGIAMHPLSQALAVRDRDLADGKRNEFADALDAYAGTGEVVLAFRLGYPRADVPPSPRRPVGAVSAQRG